MKKGLILATYDSFLRSGVKIATRINNTKFDIFILRVKENQLSENQIRNANAIQYNIKYINSIDDISISNYKIMILAVGNQACRKVFFSLKKNNLNILTISIFPGVIFKDSDSIISRIDSNIILANSYSDYHYIKSMANIYNPKLEVINYGLVNIEEHKYFTNDIDKGIYFIDQVKIPSNKTERIYVLNKIIELASCYPDKKFYIKSRVLDNKEITVHKELYSYYYLYKSLYSKPKNLYFTNENIEKLYPKMELCISFSSTVLFEAAYYGVPIISIKDLGVRNAYANSVFLDSGVIASFADLMEINKFSLLDKWKKEHIDFISNRDFILNKIINNLLDTISRENKLLFGGAYRMEDYQVNNRFWRKVRKLFFSPKMFFIDSKIIKRVLSFVKIKNN